MSSGGMAMDVVGHHWWRLLLPVGGETLRIGELVLG